MTARSGRKPPVPRGQGGFLLSKIHHLSRRVLARKMKEHGLEEPNPGQGRILFALWQGDGVPITILAERTALEKSTLTRMLDRMEADGMVRREAAPGDRRSVRVVLQPRVRGMLDDFAAVSEEMGAVFYRGVSAEEIRAFEATLEKIYANLVAED
jgi:DNA-binding MarR family transcriptional regulator